MTFRVLLVEDNPGDADLVRIALAEAGNGNGNGNGAEGFDVHHVTRLAEAIDRLGAEHFDVVLLDLSLPDSTGVEGVARVRAAHASVPIVVLTGLADKRTGFAALEQGAQRYVLKGIENARELVQSLRGAIGRGRLMGELATVKVNLRGVEERLRRKTKPS